MKSLEKLAEEIYAEMARDGEGVTMDDALQMARMELGAKEIKSYVQSSVEKKSRKPRSRKVDEEKGFILGHVESLLRELDAQEISKKTETEIHFTYGENDYTIKLTKHRPKKN